jgi:hypothetical protein
MKRQLGCLLAAVGLMFAPFLWSQSSTSGDSGWASTSGSSGSSTSTSSGTAGSTSGSSSQGVFTNWSANDQSGSGQSDQSQSGSTDNGQSDSGQSGGGLSGGGSDTSQPGVSGPQDTFGHPETLPALNLFSDISSRTGLSLSTSAGNVEQYVTGSDYPSYWQNLSLLTGGIGITQVRPKMFWSINYAGGYSYTTGLGGYNYSELNQSAGFRMNWQVAKRWQFKLKDNYLYSDDPFAPFFTFIGSPAPNDPNPVLYLPQTVVEQNQANASLLYQVGPHDAVIFSGQESFQHYLRGAISSLWNSTTYSGAVFYQHQFSPKLVGGGGYNFGALDFGHGESRAGINQFQGFIAYTFSPRLTVSGWVGPELTNTKDVVPVFCYQGGCFIQITHTSVWNIAEGATVKWKTSANNFFGLDFTHQITNGGGLLGAVSLYQVAMTYSHPLSRFWYLSAGLLYDNSLSVSSFAANQYLKTLTGTLGVSRKIFNDAWSVNAYYAFIDQKQNYIGLPGTVTTSGIGFTLAYVWHHALGGF